MRVVSSFLEEEKLGNMKCIKHHLGEKKKLGVMTMVVVIVSHQEFEMVFCSLGEMIFELFSCPLLDSIFISIVLVPVHSSWYFYT